MANKPSWKKPIGTFAILALIIGWVVTIASLSGWIGQWNIALQTVFYLVTGIIWIMPLKPVLRWMESETGD